jgi:hypothetical protein
MSINEHYFSSKSFAAVHEAFKNAYPTKPVLNITVINHLATNVLGTESICVPSIRLWTSASKFSVSYS